MENCATSSQHKKQQEGLWSPFQHARKEHSIEHVFNSTKSFKPKAPQHKIINNTHNHMMATKALFALLGTKAGVREYGQEAVAAIIS